MTQKEVYSGIVSKSFYSDFEAGKHSVTMEKFEALLKNLGISYEEFTYYKDEALENPTALLNKKITFLYDHGKFEELYQIFQYYYSSNEKDIRQLAVKAYLLVLITNTNFYKFSRDPFNEIVADLNGQKMWNLESIQLAKLVLLSLGESQKEKANELFERILKELEKYLAFDKKVYFEEIGDLYFNYVQSLLITNNVPQALTVAAAYQTVIYESNDLHLLLQYRFISLLVSLYTNFPNTIDSFQQFIKEMLTLPASEAHFYDAIGNIHREKAKNYYTRNRSK